MAALLAILLALAGVGVAALSTYLVLLAVASRLYRVPTGPFTPSHRVAVLVPAHDEADLIGRCLESLRQQDYPPALMRVLVVADNCADETAAIARAAGAEAWERVQPELPGKGRALRWAMDRLLAEPAPPDAVVVVDADAVADRRMLTELCRMLARGHEVVQGDYVALEPTAAEQRSLAGVAFTLFHRVRFAGRAALGMPANLVGNGMLFSRRVVEQYPWDAFSSVEDLEYSITLRLAGVRPVFAAAARVAAPIGGADGAARAQRRRWEGGRFYLLRRRLPALISHAITSDWSVADAALDLATPPLALLALLALAGAALSGAALLLRVVPPALLAPWGIALLAIPLFVILGLLSARAPVASFIALAGAPLFLARKLLLYAGILRHHDAARWEATAGGAQMPAAPARVAIGGVPVDVVDMHQALDRLTGLLGERTVHQVCTINVDFVVNAHRDAQLRRIFRASALNIADGSPVVWLGRLQGHRVPGRVAGADLVPRLVQAAAARNAGVFLLGGEDGVAGAAAAALRRQHAGARIDWMEPPRASIEEMDNDEIVRRINASGAEVLLVALGHPKQDLWIDRHRDRLQVSVAVGVGCCLDLIAGRVRRAPVWMQAAGLEWLFRLWREPRRLARRYGRDAVWLGPLLLRATWLRLVGQRTEEASPTAA